MSRSRTQQLFEDASALVGDARRRFLDAECGDDLGLRRQVEHLLRLDGESDFLAEERLGRLRADLGAALPALPERIGPFRILAPLGHGGMGIVYRAEQPEPRREVALKVLAGSCATPSARARFALEAEALGRLQHSGIAQIFAADVASTPHGAQPYLAMELVRGEPLHQWARDRQPAHAETLRIVLEIADAVQHAHQRSVIHRDLKPANVIVDEHGRAKVLDFGVARLLDGERDAVLQTHAGQLLGTVAYMSPEQAAGNGAAVDVRADVYSLGVIGYQLLAGVLPIDVSTDAVTRGLQRIVADEPRPLGAVDKRLRGDLETIFACALQKDPARRYASMAAFADDLRRHLAREPIRARPATFAYVASRFVRRHALSLTAVGAVFAGLVVALVASLQATQRVEEALAREAHARRDAESKAAEARREEQLKGDVLEVLGGVITSMHPGRTEGAVQLPLGERFRRALAPLDQRFRGAPEEEARVRYQLAMLLLSAGQTEVATELLTRVCELLPPEPSAHADMARFSLAKALLQQRDHRRMIALLDTLEQDRMLDTPEFLVRLAALRGQALHGLQRGDEALAVLREALTRSEAAPGLVPDDALLLVHLAMAQLFFDRGDLPALEASIAAAMPLLHEGAGADVEHGLLLLNAQAQLLYQKGDFAGAVRMFDRLLVAFERLHGPDHPGLAVLLSNRAQALRKLGSPEAAAAFERAIALIERSKGKDSAELVAPLAGFAFLRRDQQRVDEAVAMLARAVELQDAVGQPPSLAFAFHLHELAELRLRQGDRDAHLALRQRSVRTFAAVQGEFDTKVLPRRLALARLLAERGQREAALAELEAIDGKLVEVLGAGHEQAIDAAWLRASVLLDDGDFESVPEWIATFRRRAAGTEATARCEAEARRLQAKLAAARR